MQYRSHLWYTNQYLIGLDVRLIVGSDYLNLDHSE